MHSSSCFEFELSRIREERRQGNMFENVEGIRIGGIASGSPAVRLCPSVCASHGVRIGNESIHYAHGRWNDG